MATFLEDFKIFFRTIFDLMIVFWEWLSTTIIGEIIIFTILIGIFVGIIYLIIHMKD